MLHEYLYPSIWPFLLRYRFYMAASEGAVQTVFRALLMRRFVGMQSGGHLRIRDIQLSKLMVQEIEMSNCQFGTSAARDQYIVNR